ncbi:DUF3551 domain-containing protein [Bradyrhizobium sp. STM 3843]|uniref:DUF3551 domain-containing protein n=2 Tax=unclassified Bradyrhizobium TaxID=2631580 RepID=UPI003241BD90
MDQEDLQMRKLIVIAFGILGMLSIVPIATPANAANEWCSKHKGMTRCAYATEDQCRASRSGRGGTCFRRQASR